MRTLRQSLKWALASALVWCWAAVPALADDSPWFGTWKLNLAKSHFTGQTFTYSKNANGLDHFSDGATEYDFTADGKEYPIAGGVTEVWIGAGNNAWDYTDKLNGKVISMTHLELSADGKTMKTLTTGTRPDGGSMHDEATFTKIKGGAGLEGTWKSVKVNPNAPGLWVVSATPTGDWKWEAPDWKQTLVGKPDGSNLTISGPTVGTGVSAAITAAGPRKLTYVNKQDGKTTSQGVQTLSTDGKSFTDQSWVPGKENEKQTGYYEKQP